VRQNENTNKTMIEGRGEAYFIGFVPTSKLYKYEVSASGTLEKKPTFFQFMFRTKDPVDA
jgi:hypothetical protein